MRVEIAERKRTEKALLQSQGRLQRFITAIDELGLGLCCYQFRLSTFTVHRISSATNVGRF
jgi:hypothetical protein